MGENLCLLAITLLVFAQPDLSIPIILKSYNRDISGITEVTGTKQITEFT